MGEELLSCSCGRCCVEHTTRESMATCSSVFGEGGWVTLALAGTVDFPGVLLGRRLETLIALVWFLVVTCSALVLQNCLLAQEWQRPRKQEILLDSDPGWRCVDLVCFDHPAMKTPVTELADLVLDRSSPASSDVAKVLFVVKRLRRLVYLQAGVSSWPAYWVCVPLEEEILRMAVPLSLMETRALS